MNVPPPSISQLHNGEFSQIPNGVVPPMGSDRYVDSASLFQNTPASTVYTNVPLSNVQASLVGTPQHVSSSNFRNSDSVMDAFNSQHPIADKNLPNATDNAEEKLRTMSINARMPQNFQNDIHASGLDGTPLSRHSDVVQNAEDVNLSDKQVSDIYRIDRTSNVYSLPKQSTVSARTPSVKSAVPFKLDNNAPSKNNSKISETVNTDTAVTQSSHQQTLPNMLPSLHQQPSDMKASKKIPGPDMIPQQNSSVQTLPDFRHRPAANLPPLHSLPDSATFQQLHPLPNMLPSVSAGPSSSQQFYSRENQSSTSTFISSGNGRQHYSGSAVMPQNQQINSASISQARHPADLTNSELKSNISGPTLIKPPTTSCIPSLPSGFMSAQISKISNNFRASESSSNLIPPALHTENNVPAANVNSNQYFAGRQQSPMNVYNKSFQDNNLSHQISTQQSIPQMRAPFETSVQQLYQPPSVNSHTPFTSSVPSQFSQPPLTASNFGPPSQHHTNFMQRPQSSVPNIPPSNTSKPRPPINVYARGQYPPIPSSQYIRGGMYSNLPNEGETMQQQYPQEQQHTYARPGIGPQGPELSQQPPKKLDLDMVPNPIQVIQEDQEQRKDEVYQTGTRGQVPPLATTKFIVKDTGNASPRFIRSTMYSVPITNELIKQANLPFGLVVVPLAKLEPGELEPFIVDSGAKGPIRCVRCKAYMNSYMQFLDGGRRFQCCLCKAITEVTADYFQHLDHTGQRVDRYDRPEMVYGTYEFIAPKEYCRDNLLPTAPTLLFLIDVSYASVKSGMLKVFCRDISNILNLLPVDEVTGKCYTRVGFVTYSNNIQFYNVKSCLGRPQAFIVNDIEDVFLPILDGFVCDPYESNEMIQNLMTQIPEMFAGTRITDTLLLPAIAACLEAFKVLNCPGKMYVFHSTLPTANAPGKLINRDNRQVLGTDKEKTILAPYNMEYTNVAKECVKFGVGIDLFIFNNTYVDLPTLGQLSRVTGGDVYKYTYFEEEVDGPRFLRDLARNIYRRTAFDAVMKVRTSTGIRPVSCYGVASYTSTYDIEFGVITEDKALAVEIAHDDKLLEHEPVYVQIALLYTSFRGQRLIRVLNLALNCCSQLADLFRYCELDTLINFYSKSMIHKLADNNPRQTKEALTSRCAHMLATYRKSCLTPSSPGQLILPECMKLLPLYINCLLKCDAIAGGPDITVDERWFLMLLVSSMDITSSGVYFYPRLFSITDLSPENDVQPKLIRCSFSKIDNSEAYILENGVYMFLWIGNNINSEWLKNIFGVDRVQDVDTEHNKLPLLNNPYSRKLHSVMDSIQQRGSRTLKMHLVRENDRIDIVFRHFLVEDCNSGNSYDGYSVSYIDYLCYMHKEIRNIVGG